MYNLPRYCAAFIVAFACLLFVGQDVEAKKKRMKDDILKVAVRLGKDREAKFSGEKAMDDETFRRAGRVSSTSWMQITLGMKSN